MSPFKSFYLLVPAAVFLMRWICPLIPPYCLESLLRNSWLDPGFPFFDLGKNSDWIASCLTVDVATPE